jgi:hypothetical protein
MWTILASEYTYLPGRCKYVLERRVNAVEASKSSKLPLPSTLMRKYFQYFFYSLLDIAEKGGI